MTILNKPAATGDGVGFTDYKFPPSVATRIEALGKLNDRRLECVANRDIEGLRQIAAEYSAKNMIQTANVIYKEISIMAHTFAVRNSTGKAAEWERVP